MCFAGPSRRGGAAFPRCPVLTLSSSSRMAFWIGRIAPGPQNFCASICNSNRRRTESKKAEGRRTESPFPKLGCGVLPSSRARPTLWSALQSSAGARRRKEPPLRKLGAFVNLLNLPLNRLRRSVPCKNLESPVGSSNGPLRAFSPASSFSPIKFGPDRVQLLFNCRFLFRTERIGKTE